MHLNIYLYENLKFIFKVGSSLIDYFCVNLYYSDRYLLGMMTSPANVNVRSGSFTNNPLLKRELQY